MRPNTEGARRGGLVIK